MHNKATPAIRKVIHAYLCQNDQPERQEYLDEMAAIGLGVDLLAQRGFQIVKVRDSEEVIAEIAKDPLPNSGLTGSEVVDAIIGGDEVFSLFTNKRDYISLVLGNGVCDLVADNTDGAEEASQILMDFFQDLAEAKDEPNERHVCEVYCGDCGKEVDAVPDGDGLLRCPHCGYHSDQCDFPDRDDGKEDTNNREEAPKVYPEFRAYCINGHVDVEVFVNGRMTLPSYFEARSAYLAWCEKASEDDIVRYDEQAVTDAMFDSNMLHELLAGKTTIEAARAQWAEQFKNRKED